MPASITPPGSSTPAGMAAEQRRRQRHHRGAVLVDVVGQLDTGDAQLGRHDHEAPAREQRHAQLPEREIEADRREREDPVVGRDAEALGLGGDELVDAAVTDHDALGAPRRAGRVDDVGGGVDGQAGVERRHGTGLEVELVEEQRVVDGQVGGEVRRREHQGRPRVVEDEAQPRLGAVRVQRQRRRARAPHRDLGDDEVRGARQGEADEVLRPRAARPQRPGEPGGPVGELPVRQRVPAAHDGDGVRAPGDLLGEAVGPGPAGRGGGRGGGRGRGRARHGCHGSGGVEGGAASGGRRAAGQTAACTGLTSSAVTSARRWAASEATISPDRTATLDSNVEVSPCVCSVAPGA